MTNTTIGFIIPLKPRIKSNNWEDDCRVLANTVRSVLNQSNPAFRAYVIYTDPPLYQLTDERISYIPLPFAYDPFEKIPEHVALLTQFKSEKMVERRWDKARKVTYGSSLAVNDGCSYIMSLDSDDLLSAKLVQYISEHNQGESIPGWIIDKGYLYKEGTRYLQRIPCNLHLLNGSTAILHRSLITIPDFDTASYLELNLFTDHGWVYERIRTEQNKVLLFVPFPAVVYMVHGNNASQIGNGFSRFSIRNLLKKLFYGRPVTKAIKDEFSFVCLLVFTLQFCNRNTSFFESGCFL